MNPFNLDFIFYGGGVCVDLNIAVSAVVTITWKGRIQFDGIKL